MNQDLPENTSFPSEAPLFCIQTTTDFASYKKLCWTVSGRRLVICGFFLGLLGLILVFSCLSPGTPVFAGSLAASLLFPFILWGSYSRVLRKNYNATKFTQDLTAAYSFFADHFTAQSQVSQSRIDYCSIYKILETKTSLTILLGPNQGFALEKAACPEGLTAFLQTFGKTCPAMRRLDLAAVCLGAVSLSLVALYLAINSCFRPEGYLLQNWVKFYLFTPALLLLAAALVLIFASLCTGRLAAIQKRAVRLILQVFAALIGFFCAALCLLLALLVWADSDKQLQNADGTITVIHSVWLDEPVSRLYTLSGPFYLCPVQDSSPFPVFSEAKPHPTPAPAVSAGSESSSSSVENSDNLLESGYQAIYSHFLAETCPLYEEEAHAKGNSYIVLNDTDSFIEALEFDRDSQNGQCGLYVYYRCPKSSDGSWSVQEQEILNIYAYEYATGAIAVSGKTNWASPATQAYLDLTGE